MTSRKKSSGFVPGYQDFSSGESMLSSKKVGVENALFGGLQSLIDDANESAAAAGRKSTAWLLSHTDDTSATSAGGTIDMSMAGKLVEEARKQIGTPYHWGGKGPGTCSKTDNDRSNKTPVNGYVHDKCFDCSGLCYYVYKTVANMSIPTPAHDQVKNPQGRPVLGMNPTAEQLKNDPMPGDLVFFYSEENGDPYHVTHVGMCVGGGSGKFIEAPGTGKVVKESELASRTRDIHSIKRYLPETAYVAPTTSVSTPAGGWPIGNYDAYETPEMEAALKAMVRAKALEMYGWGDAEWPSLEQLIQNESGWNPEAQNPTSTAYGLFQFLDSTWGGRQKTGDPELQTNYGLDYISKRYKTPSKALSTWQSRSPHWY